MIATAANPKIHPLDQLAQRIAALRPGRTVVHCHGVYDLLHIGHIRHLESARRLGDLLVVTLTPDRYVNKGPGRPAFTETLRAEAIAALACVDYVAINHWPTAVQTIHTLRPDLYVKGPDYKIAADDRTGGILDEQRAVEAVGGRIAFTDDPTHSSSSLINRHLPVLPEHVRTYLDSLRGRYSSAEVLDILDRIRGLRVCIVGEAILDDYHYVTAIGKSSKEPILAVKEISSERFAGGALAVANHLANFVDTVTLVTALGPDSRQRAFVESALHPKVVPSILDTQRPTIVKRRYIDRYFFQKLFEVYEMDDSPERVEPPDARDPGRLGSAAAHGLDHGSPHRLHARLSELIPTHDLTIAIDFGHGLIGGDSVNVLCQNARYLAVNAQSNAGNLGYHTISKYPRADYVSLAENELRLEARDRTSDLTPLAAAVGDRLGVRRLAVTRGSHGCLGIERAHGQSAACEVPALATEVRDRMGAGDSFLAVTAPCAAVNAPMELIGLIGNAAAAQKVATVGNSRAVDRTALIRHLECLMK